MAMAARAALTSPVSARRVRWRSGRRLPDDHDDRAARSRRWRSADPAQHQPGQRCRVRSRPAPGPDTVRRRALRRARSTRSPGSRPAGPHGSDRRGPDGRHRRPPVRHRTAHRTRTGRAEQAGGQQRAGTAARAATAQRSARGSLGTGRRRATAGPQPASTHLPAAPARRPDAGCRSSPLPPRRAGDRRDRVRADPGDVAGTASTGRTESSAARQSTTSRGEHDHRPPPTSRPAPRTPVRAGDEFGDHTARAGARSAALRAAARAGAARLPHRRRGRPPLPVRRRDRRRSAAVHRGERRAVPSRSCRPTGDR